MNRTTTAVAALAVTLPLAAAGLMPAAGAQTQAAKYTVTASINSKTAIAKETIVKIRGRVTPKAAGEKVVLQQRLAGRKKWAVSGTARIKPTGKYLVKDDPSVAGTRYYRVKKAASGNLGAGVSKELRLVVYGWERLASRASGPSVGVTTGTVLIGTDSYAGSLYGATPGAAAYREYTLGDKCLQLKATYALTDSSATGATGSVAVSKDAVLAMSTPLAIGTVAPRVTDVRDAFRIRFDFTSTQAPDAYPAAADAQVLCTR